MQQIESVIAQPARGFFAEFAAERLAIGDPRRAVNHRLAVEDGLLNFEMSGRFSNGAELVDPVEPGPRVHRRVSILQVELGAITVHLDLVDPVFSRRRTLPQGWITRFDVSWKFCFACSVWSSEAAGFELGTQGGCTHWGSMWCSSLG